MSRAQRAEALAMARREEKQRMKNVKYGITSDPADPAANFYPRTPRRPTTPRPNSAAGLAMRNAEAVRGGFVDASDEEKKKETVTTTSWKYLHTCVGIIAGRPDRGRLAGRGNGSVDEEQRGQGRHRLHLLRVRHRYLYRFVTPTSDSSTQR